MMWTHFRGLVTSQISHLGATVIVQFCLCITKCQKYWNY